ncbi:MAG: hypothetical protein RLZZ519_3286 [Bacteroidota bacterium]
MNKRINIFITCIGLMGLTFGCLPEKEVEIEIPPYERQLVVECFMEVGSPFRLLVSESIGFFEPQDTPIIAGAEVVISHNGVHDTLPQGLYFDPMGLKIFNFASSNTVPADFNTEYSLSVKYPDGRHITGTAKVMPKVELEPMTASFNADSNASVLVRWPDQVGQQNFYRLALFKGKVFDPNPDNENTQLLDFTLDDRIGDGEMFTIGTLFDFKSGDTIIAQLYHIDQPYWRYINSLDDAASSNGNPFAQPGVIRSTVSGGIGVFTGYQFDRDTLIIP